MTLSGAAADNSPTRLTLSTQDGPLQLTGSGTWGPGGVRFRGEARAAAVDEAALSNLLNIIGRRDGAKSVISIG
jgi:general secretion pathway protein N